MAMPYPGMVFVPFDILTAEELNQMVANDASFANGTGFNAGAVTTAAIADGAVTGNKLELLSVTNKIATPEVALGVSFGDMATVGPSVDVVVPSNGRLFVSWTASINSNDPAQAGRCAFSLTGANTRAAQDDEAIETQGIYNTCSRDISLTGLNPGLTTVKMVYLRTGGTSTFRRRSLTVIPGV